MTAESDADRAHANYRVLKSCAILGVFFFIAITLFYIYSLQFGGNIPRDGSTLVVGRDFLNFWMYGRAVDMPNPGIWYDPVVYEKALAAIVGDNYPGQNWSYPPSLMLLMAPFGKLPYLPALFGWTVLGLLMFVPMTRRFLGSRLALVAALCSPAAIFGLISGQLTFITTAMMAGAFFWLDKRPRSAGTLIGLLTIKPHVGLLYPVMLIFSGRWRVFAVAAVTTLALVVISAWLFGVQPWKDFVLIGLPVQNTVLADPEGIATPFFPTVFMNLRGIGASYGIAMTVQTVVAASATGVMAWAFRHRSDADPYEMAALFFACSIAAVPYLLSYGTLAVCVAALALLERGTLDATGRVLARLVYWLPLIQIGLGTYDIPGAALISPAFAIYLAMRLKAQPALAPSTQPA